MRTFTSASAAKYLKSLQEKKDHLISVERSNCVYQLAPGEEADPPEYDYEAMRREIAEIDDRMRAVRHALHVFNANEVLPESGITIDEALILLAQLGGEKNRLSVMRSRQPKERVSGGFYHRGDTIEYRFANYDLARAEKDYLEVSERVSNLQLELDLCNQTRTFEVDA